MRVAGPDMQHRLFCCCLCHCNLPSGWGYTARRAVKCDAGWYNAGDNLNPCQQCPIGQTTAGPGQGKSSADCRADLGYGNSGLCPVGSYNDVAATNASDPCTACPDGTTTARDGATSKEDCSCKLGRADAVFGEVVMCVGCAM